MPKRSWKKRLQRIGVALVGAPLLFCLATNAVVLNSHGKIFTSLESLPKEPIGLVLGTSPTLGGRPNPFFVRRMDAAAELYTAGKVEKLLVSGDNGSVHYDEPAAMRSALMARGVPARDIVVDDAGFRTLDSIVRAKKVFGVARCTIVTDDFHLPRALYIAAQEGPEAVGYQTRPLDHNVSPWTYVREVGARSLVWIDLHITNRQPRFLGPAQRI